MRDTIAQYIDSTGIKEKNWKKKKSLELFGITEQVVKYSLTSGWYFGEWVQVANFANCGAGQRLAIL